jgi:hypothetical protein
VTTYKAAASATAIQLPYLPVYAGATGAAQNIITKNGATFAVTSVSTTTGGIVIPSAVAADIYVVVYQTNFRAA